MCSEITLYYVVSMNDARLHYVIICITYTVEPPTPRNLIGSGTVVTNSESTKSSSNKRGGSVVEASELASSFSEDMFKGDTILMSASNGLKSNDSMLSSIPQLHWLNDDITKPDHVNNQPSDVRK